MPKLVKLFNSPNQEVQRHATGAMRNLIYDNAENKLALVEENGIYELMRTLREPDDELRKNVTGWGQQWGGRGSPSPEGGLYSPHVNGAPRGWSLCLVVTSTSSPGGGVGVGVLSRRSSTEGPPLCRDPVESVLQ